MKVAALADQHGKLPAVPECDLLIVAGDMGGTAEWLDGPFREWLEAAPAPVTVGIAGNMDFDFKFGEQPADLPWRYLQDSGTEVGGLRVWGSPWTPGGPGFAFSAAEEELREPARLVPGDTDLLVLHGPPRRFGDRASGGRHVGSVSFLETVLRVRPRLCVYGHIHRDRGVWRPGAPWGIDMTLANVSLGRGGEPMVFEL